MKKSLALLLTTTLVLSAFSGCAGSAAKPSTGSSTTAASSDVSAASSATETKPITLTIASAMVTEDPEGGLEQAIADKYMEMHPNVTIEFISTPAPEVAKRVVTLAASNDLPDLFFVPNDFMPQLYDLEVTADLETLMGKEWLDGCNQNLLKDVKVNDKMMSIPFYASPYAVIYRLDWFQELGLTAPKTWDEFVAVSKKMTRDTNGDGKVDKWAFSMVGTRNNSGEQRFVLVSKSFGVDEIYQDTNGKWATGVSDPKFKDALKLFTDLYTQHGVVPPGPVEVDYAASMELFTTEKTGMILSGPHSLGFITKQNPNLEGKLGSFVIPMQANHASISGIGGYTISKSCENKEVAADYMKFVNSKENAINFGQKTGRMPIRTESASDPFFSSALFSGFLEAMNYCADPETFTAYPALLDTIGEAYSTILSGSETLDSAYDKLVTKAEAVIEENS